MTTKFELQKLVLYCVIFWLLPYHLRAYFTPGNVPLWKWDTCIIEGEKLTGWSWSWSRHRSRSRRLCGGRRCFVPHSPTSLFSGGRIIRWRGVRKSQAFFSGGCSTRDRIEYLLIGKKERQIEFFVPTVPSFYDIKFTRLTITNALPALILWNGTVFPIVSSDLLRIHEIIFFAADKPSSL